LFDVVRGGGEGRNEIRDPHNSTKHRTKKAETDVDDDAAVRRTLSTADHSVLPLLYVENGCQLFPSSQL
jgi:hypothetical protein